MSNLFQFSSMISFILLQLLSTNEGTNYYGNADGNGNYKYQFPSSPSAISTSNDVIDRKQLARFGLTDPIHGNKFQVMMLVLKYYNISGIYEIKLNEHIQLLETQKILLEESQSLETEYKVLADSFTSADQLSEDKETFIRSTFPELVNAAYDLQTRRIPSVDKCKQLAIRQEESSANLTLLSQQRTVLIDQLNLHINEIGASIRSDVDNQFYSLHELIQEDENNIESWLIPTSTKYLMDSDLIEHNTIELENVLKKYSSTLTPKGDQALDFIVNDELLGKLVGCYFEFEAVLGIGSLRLLINRLNKVAVAQVQLIADKKKEVHEPHTQVFADILSHMDSITKIIDEFNKKNSSQFTFGAESTLVNFKNAICAMAAAVIFYTRFKTYIIFS